MRGKSYKIVGPPRWVNSRSDDVNERHSVSRALTPGEMGKTKLVFTLLCDVALNASLDVWQSDAVTEGIFWFFGRGIPSCSIPCV